MRRRLSWQGALGWFIVGVLAWFAIQLWTGPQTMVERVEETVQEFQRAVEQQGR